MATQGQDNAVLRDQFLYDLDDPEKAFNNALMDQGINPFASNPFTRRLKATAPGLVTNFIAERASSTSPFANSGDVKNVGQMLRSELGGLISSGDIYKRLQKGQARLSSDVNMVREFEKQLGQGVSIDRLNPFTALLRDRFAADDGAGLTGAALQYGAPSMTPSLARAYSTGLDSTLMTGQRRFANSPNPLKTDIWKYLIGF